MSVPLWVLVHTVLHREGRPALLIKFRCCKNNCRFIRIILKDISRHIDLNHIMWSQKDTKVIPYELTTSWDTVSRGCTGKLIIMFKEEILCFSDLQRFNFSPCCSVVQMYSRTLGPHCWLWWQVQQSTQREKQARNVEADRSVKHCFSTWCDIQRLYLETVFGLAVLGYCRNGGVTWGTHSMVTKTQQYLFPGDYTLIKTDFWILYSISIKFHQQIQLYLTHWSFKLLLSTCLCDFLPQWLHEPLNLLQSDCLRERAEYYFFHEALFITFNLEK